MHYLKQFVSDYLRMVGDNYGGEITVNQIRVLHFVSCHLLEGNPFATHSAICKGLGLPAATVTRAIGTFFAKGVLKEDLDPDHGRRRRIRFCEGQPGNHVRERYLGSEQNYQLIFCAIFTLAPIIPRLSHRTTVSESVRG